MLYVTHDSHDKDDFWGPNPLSQAEQLLEALRHDIEPIDELQHDGCRPQMAMPALEIAILAVRKKLGQAERLIPVYWQTPACLRRYTLAIAKNWSIRSAPGKIQNNPFMQRNIRSAVSKPPAEENATRNHKLIGAFNRLPTYFKRALHDRCNTPRRDDELLENAKYEFTGVPNPSNSAQRTPKLYKQAIAVMCEELTDLPWDYKDIRSAVRHVYCLLHHQPLPPELC